VQCLQYPHRRRLITARAIAAAAATAAITAAIAAAATAAAAHAILRSPGDV
jgi:hypothetical protein